jgi:hypothetical protein
VDERDAIHLVPEALEAALSSIEWSGQKHFAEISLHHPLHFDVAIPHDAMPALCI